jgi:hypothetical protein
MSSGFQQLERAMQKIKQRPKLRNPNGTALGRKLIHSKPQQSARFRKHPHNAIRSLNTLTRALSTYILREDQRFVDAQEAIKSSPW